MSEKARVLANSVFCGIILSNLAIISSSSFEEFALLPLTVTWLYVTAFACGSILGITLDDARHILYGVVSMALIAVLIHSGVLIFISWLNQATSFNTVSLLAFQQSFVRFVFIFVLGGVGAICGTVLKVALSGRV